MIKSAADNFTGMNPFLMPTPTVFLCGSYRQVWRSTGKIVQRVSKKTMVAFVEHLGILSMAITDEFVTVR
jgi:hypothetical protein